MKKTLYLTMIFLIFLSCDQIQKESETKNQLFKDTITTQIKVDSNEEQTLKNVPKAEEIIKSASVKFSDTNEPEFYNLVDVVQLENPKLSTVLPVTHGDGKWHGIFQQGDSLKFIPFFIDPDWEVQMFTKWKILSDTTIKYISRLNPDFESKYAFSTILEIVNIEGEEYFIGETSGGEGGETWESIWTAKYNGTDELIKEGHYDVGYTDDCISMTLDYELRDNILSIKLNIDSIKYSSDSIILLPIKREIVKSVELK